MNQRTVPHERLASPGSSRSNGAGFAAGGALASIGALLAAASCCVLPLALTALGFGVGLSSTFAVLMPLRWPLTALSVLGLAAGWWFYARRRRACAADRTCTAPSRATPPVLATGTILTVITLIWDRLEAPLVTALS